MIKNKLVLLVPLVVFIALCVIAGIALINEETDQDFTPALTAGQQIPEATYDYINQERLSEQRHIVNFFASWCAPCLIEHPVMMDLSEDIRIIGVNYKDEAAAMQSFLDDLGDPYEQVIEDRLGDLGLDWGVSRLPVTFIIDNGQIIYRHDGPLTKQSAALQILPYFEDGHGEDKAE